MTPEQIRSPNRRWPKGYESWMQRRGLTQFIELRDSTKYPLTHHPYGDWTYTACGTEYTSRSTQNDLTTYVR